MNLMKRLIVVDSEGKTIAEGEINTIECDGDKGTMKINTIGPVLVLTPSLDSGIRIQRTYPVAFSDDESTAAKTVSDISLQVAEGGYPLPTNTGVPPELWE
jgi:hypothetical protein